MKPIVSRQSRKPVLLDCSDFKFARPALILNLFMMKKLLFVALMLIGTLSFGATPNTGIATPKKSDLTLYQPDLMAETGNLNYSIGSKIINAHYYKRIEDYKDYHCKVTLYLRITITRADGSSITTQTSMSFEADDCGDAANQAGQWLIGLILDLVAKG